MTIREIPQNARSPNQGYVRTSSGQRGEDLSHAHLEAWQEVAEGQHVSCAERARRRKGADRAVDGIDQQGQTDPLMDVPGALVRELGPRLTRRGDLDDQIG